MGAHCLTGKGEAVSQVPAQAVQYGVQEKVEHSASWFENGFGATATTTDFLDATCWAHRSDLLTLLVLNPDTDLRTADVKRALAWDSGDLGAVLLLSLVPKDMDDDALNDYLEDSGLALFSCLAGFAEEWIHYDAGTYRSFEVTDLGRPPSEAAALREWTLSVREILTRAGDKPEVDDRPRDTPLSGMELVMRTWDPDRNDRSAADVDVLVDTDLVLSWRCEKGHRWTSNIGDRFRRPEAYACPICCPNEDVPVSRYEDSLEAMHPEIAAIWDSLRADESSSPPAADIHHYNLSRSVIVQCSEPGHYPGQLHIEDFLTGFGVDGHTCWACRVSREHDGVRPGEIMRSWGAPTSRTERRLAKHLAEWFVLADEDMNTIKFAQAFMTYPWGKPDIIIPGLRVAVEFDGTGAAGVEDGHDTDDGKTVDILKDELMREVGWEVVRVRTSGMPRLGPFDVQAEAISPGTVREIAWMVLRAADSLDTLDANLHALSEKANDLLVNGI